MRLRFHAAAAATAVLAGLFVFSGYTAAIQIGQDTMHGAPLRVMVMDGSNVHDVGELHMHVGNWGLFGSFPSASFPFSHAPSAEWPAGSGIEHLFGAGFWVGALKNGIPAVSTSMFEFELRPTDDPIDIIYRSHEGAPGGARVPFPNADDDHDGLIDEDFLDGHDNDGDGLVDEDFAAVSDQMFSCWYTDDQPAVAALYPEHEPLPIMVRQESYQWSDDRIDDFVGVTFTITNTGTDLLEDVYLGMYIDFDIGPRTTPNYWDDDAIGYWTGSICTEFGPATISMAYGYDADGDGGRTPSYFGVMVLDHLIDPLGLVAPERVGIGTYRTFSGDLPYEQGGDPTNDFQRYELLASHQIDRNKETPADYRTLIGTGPFASLPPGESLVFSIGFVAGFGLDGLIENAALAQRLYDGTWYDLDGDPMTGIDRRETPIHGPAQNVVIDACRVELSEPIDVPARTTVWINGDCRREADYKSLCGYGEADSLLFRTGVAGREARIHWLLEQPPPMIDALDIRPGDCPNPFNVKWFDQAEDAKSGKGGVLPVAVLGSEDFDVRDIDIEHVSLEGVAPLSTGRGYEDVSRPADGAPGCACISSGSDGYLDLTLKFRIRDIAAALAAGGRPVPGEERMLTLMGRLDDGTDFVTSDCVTFVGNPHLPDAEGDRRMLGDGALNAAPRLIGAAPNPFNPITRIAYSLPERNHVRLAIYDVAGRLVKLLVDGVQPAGIHEVTWNAAGLGSGIYVYRLEAGETVLNGKLVLLR